MSHELPTGTVTFLFTDVEGSTRLLHELGAEEYAKALTEHRRVLREAFAAYGGVEVDTQGDAFFVAFPTAPGAIAAADAARLKLAPGPIHVRMGVHTGTPLVTDEGYIGADVHRAARIAACGHGNQVLVSTATAALIGVDALRDLGMHRLKDLSAPERIYQLGDGEFPPLRSLHQTNLPIPSTPFLGREHELGDVLALLARDDVRLLTLTGPGGTGKTRLGAQAAGALAERYPHGVWWIPLAPLRDPALVLETAGQTIGARDGLADHIGDRSMLLLFDNFEHLLDAAADIAALLESCPNVEVLVTSREPLHVSGEQEYSVPPFSHEEGVGFFLARARSVDPRFEAGEAVSEICRRLDDLPLALELAAARVKALSSEHILERLEQRLPLLTGGARDRPERQRTLRATIEWSYDLLVREERQLFARLAVFRGGCTLEAAETIADADVDTLQSLVDKSLVRHTRDRYWMLETIREFADVRLTAFGDADGARERHAGHFLALAEEVEPHLLTSPKEWLELLDREHDNLRAALDWFDETGDGRRAQRLTGILWKFWYQRGLPGEGLRRLEAALAADETPTAARGMALAGASAIALAGGDSVTARSRADDALALNRLLEDEWGIANSMHMLANVEARSGNYETARDLYENALRRFRHVGDEHYVLLAMRLLGWMSFELGDRRRAQALHEEVVERARAADDLRMEATSLGALAEYDLIDGRVADALPRLERAYRIAGDFREIGANLGRFARALALSEGADLSAQLLGSSAALHESAGVNAYPWTIEFDELTVAMTKRELDEAAFARAWEHGRGLEPDEAVALALEGLEDVRGP